MKSMGFCLTNFTTTSDAMAQFDIYRNLSRDTEVAYLLQVQSNRFDRTQGRVVVALRHRRANAPPDHASTPHLTVLGTPVFVDTLDIVALPARRLGAPVAFLPEADHSGIITAIDELISRA